MDRKILLLVVLVGIVLFAAVPRFAPAQPEGSLTVNALAALSSQLSAFEDNTMVRLASIDQRVATLEVTTGASLLPLMQGALALLGVAVVLCVVNMVLLLRRLPAAAKKPKPEAKLEAKPKE
jgi:hypothetical protein